MGATWTTNSGKEPANVPRGGLPGGGDKYWWGTPSHGGPSEPKFNRMMDPDAPDAIHPSSGARMRNEETGERLPDQVLGEPEPEDIDRKDGHRQVNQSKPADRPSARQSHILPPDDAARTSHDFTDAEQSSIIDPARLYQDGPKNITGGLFTSKSSSPPPPAKPGQQNVVRDQQGGAQLRDSGGAMQPLDIWYAGEDAEPRRSILQRIRDLWNG